MTHEPLDRVQRYSQILLHLLQKFLAWFNISMLIYTKKISFLGKTSTFKLVLDKTVQKLGHVMKFNMK